MSFSYATIKSSFHGGGVHSRHHTFEATCKAAEKWGLTPSLGVAELIDGKYYLIDWCKGFGSAGGYERHDTHEEPVPDRIDSPFAGPYDCIL